MPVERSPPSQSTRAKTCNKFLNRVETRSRSRENYSQLAVNTVDSPPAHHVETTKTTAQVSLSTVSWSTQCSTPTFDSLLLASSTNKIPTSTCGISSATTTTTTVYSLLSSASTSSTSSLLSLKSSQHAATTLIAPSTFSTAPPFCSSVSSPTTSVTEVPESLCRSSLECLTTTASTAENTTLNNLRANASKCTNLSKENPKRSRYSPNQNETNLKKAKTKQNITGLHRLNSAPTNNVNRSNRFSVLADEDECDNQSIDCPIKPKPPPIFVQKVDCIGNLTKLLSNVTDCKYQLQILRNNQVKIVTDETLHFEKIINLLNGVKAEYFTYKPKELRGFRVVLRGIHHSTDVNDIKEELSVYGHEVLYIRNMFHPITKKPMSLFSVELKKDESNSKIFGMNCILHCKISVERPRKSRTVPQCMNCQQYGHTKNFCTKSPVYVKCAGKHSSGDCSHPPGADVVKCALCGAQHTANYKGCSIYKAIRAKKFLNKAPLKPIGIDRETTNEKGIILNNPIKKGVSYADAAKSDATTVSIVEENLLSQNQTSDMQELKDMMKQLMSQIASMLQLITVLISQSNVPK